MKEAIIVSKLIEVVIDNWFIGGGGRSVVCGQREHDRVDLIQREQVVVGNVEHQSEEGVGVWWILKINERYVGDDLEVCEHAPDLLTTNAAMLRIIMTMLLTGAPKG